jgi:hypothetical protein
LLVLHPQPLLLLGFSLRNRRGLPGSCLFGGSLGLDPGDFLVCGFLLGLQFAASDLGLLQLQAFLLFGGFGEALGLFEGQTGALLLLQEFSLVGGGEGLSGLLLGFLSRDLVADTFVLGLLGETTGLGCGCESLSLLLEFNFFSCQPFLFEFLKSLLFESEKSLLFDSLLSLCFYSFLSFFFDSLLSL